MDTPSTIVARYLKANHYKETYAAFLQEARLPPHVGDYKEGQIDLDTLLEEKATYDLVARAERLGLEDGNALSWSSPAPTIANEVHGISIKSNILQVLISELNYENGQVEVQKPTSTADKKLLVVDLSSLKVIDTLVDLHDSPILSFVVLARQNLLTSSMSGQLRRSNNSGDILEKRQDHSKYVVKIAVFQGQESEERYIATAGWDSKVLLYKIGPKLPINELGSPFATITLPTKPEAIAFAPHPDTGKPVLLLSRTDSTFIFFYAIDGRAQSPCVLGMQNLAPHSNSWVAFTPAAFQISPEDSGLIAIALSTVPHMKLLIVRLLFPPWDISLSEDAPAKGPNSNTPSASDAMQTQVEQSRASLALAEREDAAIQINCNTLAPQTAYSTPAIAWRPDGSGVWVNGDDGVVRGIETRSGKVVAYLKGHEAGSKVRCLWAGSVRSADGEDQETIVSGGFDRRLIVWRPA